MKNPRTLEQWGVIDPMPFVATMAKMTILVYEEKK
jgi:hypothetical protein